VISFEVIVDSAFKVRIRILGDFDTREKVRNDALKEG